MVFDMHGLLPASSPAMWLGSDSFAGAAILSPWIATSRGWFLCAASFGLCDGLASLAGPGLVPASASAAMLLMLAAGVAVATMYPRRWAVLVPILCCVDNLFAASPVAPLQAGLSSTVMASAGLLAGWGLLSRARGHAAI